MPLCEIDGTEAKVRENRKRERARERGRERERDRERERETERERERDRERQREREKQARGHGQALRGKACNSKYCGPGAKPMLQKCGLGFPELHSGSVVFSAKSG